MAYVWPYALAHLPCDGHYRVRPGERQALRAEQLLRERQDVVLVGNTERKVINCSLSQTLQMPVIFNNTLSVH